jgi:hypothetical protein
MIAAPCRRVRQASHDRRVTLWRGRGLAALLAVLSFALHLGLTREFERLGVFDQRDLLFDADPDSRLAAFSAGRHLGIKHPNLMPYFSPPIGAAAKLIVSVLPSADEREVRRRLGILVVPAASALKTALIFILFQRLGHSLLVSVSRRCCRWRRSVS